MRNLDLPRALGIGAAVVVVAVAVCFGLSPVTTTDFFWQLASGDWILQGGGIPRADPFSYTTQGNPWIDLHWGFQIALSALYRVVGIDGLVLVRASLVGLLALLLLRGFTRGFTSGAALVSGLLAVLASQERFFLRPEIVTFLLFVVTLLLLDRHARGEIRRGIFLLVPVLMIWVNVHSLFAVGLAVIGLAVIGELVDAARRTRGLLEGPAPPEGALLRLAVTLGLGALACLVNPYGPRAVTLPLLQFTRRIGPGNPYAESISEFQSPLSGGFGATALTAAAALLGLVALGSVATWRRLPARQLLIAGACTWLAFRAGRNLPLFALAAVPLILSAAGIVAGTPWGRRVATRRTAVALRAGVLVVGILLVFGITSNRLYLRDGAARRFGSGVMAGVSPVAAADYVMDTGAPDRLFHALSDGGYLIWKMFPDRQVFLDGRLEVQDEGVYRSYLRALQQPEEFERLAERWDIRTVLFNHALGGTAAPLLRYLRASPSWVPVHLDMAAVVFVRADATAAVLQPLDLSAVSLESLESPLQPDSPHSHATVGDPGLRQPTPLDRLLQGLNPWRLDLPLARARAGIVLGVMGETAAAETFLLACDVAGTLSPEVLFNLGILAESVGRLEDAAGRYRQALRNLGRPWNPIRRMLRRDLRRALEDRLRAATVSGPAGPPADDDPARRLASEAYRLQMEGRSEQALSAYRQALELAPRDPVILHNLGVALLQAGQFAAAAGDLALAGSRLEEAERTFVAAAAGRAEFAPSHHELGVVRLMLDRPTAAVSALAEAARLQPDDAAYRHHLAMALDADGQLDAALVELDRAVALAPGLATAHLDRARTLRRLERVDEAWDALMLCRELGLQDPALEQEISRVQELQVRELQ